MRCISFNVFNIIFSLNLDSILIFFQNEKPVETTDRKTPKLYPDLFKCDLENVEDVLKGTFYEQLVSH